MTSAISAPARPLGSHGPLSAPPERSSRRRRFIRPWRAALVTAGALTGMWMLTACQPPAATFVVDTNVDAPDASIGDGVCATAAGQCSLRAAVQEGNTNVDQGPIRVELGGFEVYPLTIAGAGENAAATGDLDVTRPFQFVGTGLPRVSATGDRVFEARPGGHLEITGLEVSGVASDRGGAVRATAANLTITDSLLSGTAGTDGGAIWSESGTLTLRGTGITRAVAPSSGALRADRIVMSSSSISGASSTTGSVVNITQFDAHSTIDSSTIVGNESELAGIVGAVGYLDVRDTTIARNTSLSGAVVFLQGVTFSNSIVADQDAGPDCNFPVTSLGSNLESGTSCGFTAANDLQSTAPGFAANTVTAGTTTLLPLVSGAAIDSGAGCLALDQAGTARPLDGDADGTAVCDRGAAEGEAQPLLLVVDTTADGVDADPGDGLCATAGGACTFRAAVMETNARNTTDIIELPGSTIHGTTITGAEEDAGLTGDVDVAGDVTIRSADEGGALTFLDGNDHDRALDVHSGTVVLDHVAIGDGTAAAGGGGLRVGAGSDVTLRQSTIFANVGSGGGGGVRAAGALTVDRSTIYSNTGGAHGGAILVDAGGLLQLVNSTLASNTATTGSALSVDAGASAAIIDSTVAGNIGVGIEPIGAVTIQGSIVSDHAAGNCSAALTSLGRNIDSGPTCGLTGTGDFQVNPQLGPLAGNGGPTLTRLPAPTSLAVGTNTCNTATDQRGVARPQAAACDRGSVEQ